MTSPEEEQRKKSAEAKAKEPDKSAASNDAFSFVGQLIGDAKNLAVDTVAGEHSGEKVLSGITPQLAAQYQHGKDVQARIDSGAVKQDQLSEADRRYLDAYNNVRKSVTQVLLYDRDSLLRYVEKGIEQKAKTAPPESKSSSPAARSTQPEAGRPVAQPTTAPKDANKPLPKEASRPAAQESNKPTSAKDVSAKPPAARPQEQPVSKASPDAPDAKKVPAQSVQQQHKELPGAVSPQAASDAKTSGVKPQGTVPPQERTAAHTPERNPSQPAERNVTHLQDRNFVQPGDGKSVPSKAQFEPAQSNTSKDRVDSTKIMPTSTDKIVPHNLEKQSLPSIAPGSKSAEQGPSPRTTGADHQQPVCGDAQANKQFLLQTSAASAFERRTSGNTKNDDLRSVLEGRVSFANNQSKFKSSEHQQNKPAASGENVSARASGHTEQPYEKAPSRAEQFSGSPLNRAEASASKSGSADSSGKVLDSQVPQHRISLAEIKRTVSPERMQQIVRDSQERFPAGLQWQNTITRQEYTSGAKTTRQAEISTPNVAPANRSVDVTVRNTAATSHGSTESASSVVKQPQQPGVIQPEVKQSGVVQPGVSQLGGIHPGSNPVGSKLDLTQGGTERQPGVSRPIQPSTPGANPLMNVRDQKGGATSEGQTRAIHHSQDMIFADARILTFRGRIEDRYITGAEIALAAIFAAAGAKRVRFDELQPPGKETTIHIPMVQSIEAYLPNRANLLSGNAGAAPDLKDGIVIQQTSDTEEVTDRPTGDQVAGILKTGDRAPSDRKPADRKGDDESAVDDLSADDVPGTLRYLQTHRYVRRTMLIGPGDTLVGIAEAKCDDSIYGWLVADLNITKTKETYVDGKRIVEVRSRETIDLPTREDMDAFDRHRREEFKPENLITIVVETQIDRELLDEHLGIFVEGAASASGSSSGSLAGAGSVLANPAAASMFQRTTAGADGSLSLPSLALESVDILRIATSQLMKLTQRAFETGRNPFSKFRELLKRERIRRRF